MYDIQEPPSAADATRLTEQLERVVREDREWATAQLHAAMHGTYVTPAECALCLALDAEAEA